MPNVPTQHQEQDEQSKRDEETRKSGEKRSADIDKIKDEDERKIVKLHNEGVQTYAIAKQVYKFVNGDTVGQVVLIIRKHYADDYNEVEDINSTKGYTGV